MTGLQAPLASLPSVGIYALGAALIAILGGAGAGSIASVAPGTYMLHFSPPILFPPLQTEETLHL